jgi:hypothetical protein
VLTGDGDRHRYLKDLSLQTGVGVRSVPSSASSSSSDSRTQNRLSGSQSGFPLVAMADEVPFDGEGRRSPVGLEPTLPKGRLACTVGGLVPHLVNGGISIPQYAGASILFTEHDLAKA